MMSVKICGLKDEAMVHAAAEAGADWVGFNLVPGSPRLVSRKTCARLVQIAREAGVATAVLVADPDFSDCLSILDEIAPDIIQMHGHEPPEFVEQVRRKASDAIEIWKAVGVSAREDLDALSVFAAADRLLVDAKPPEGAAYGGGHGTPFDWAILKGWTAPKPWLLAGGLNPGNVADAIRATGAAAVDVSSGVERARGVKDEELIRTFIAAAKAA